jgi:hypothetical protein
MKVHFNTRMLASALTLAALAALSLSGTAQAKLVKEFVKFQYCPYTNVEVKKCLWANTESGEVKLGSKTVPIVNPVLVQGGLAAVNIETKFAKLVGPTEGKPVLAPVAQPVPGGLAGLVNCKEIENFILKAACEWTFENGLTGLNSTLELAGSAASVEISESNIARREGTGLHMPVKVHLENPFLGSSCYVGSNTNPIIWNLTSGVTTPPEGVEPLEGASGITQALEGGRILQLNGNKLVENNWSSPSASGCGGLFSFLLDPIVNAAAGLPAGAGVNKAILNNTIDTATAAAVKKNNEENP